MVADDELARQHRAGGNCGARGDDGGGVYEGASRATCISAPRAARESAIRRIECCRVSKRCINGRWIKERAAD
jgi:hypothetical protein